MVKPLPDASLLREYLSYSPKTGILRWRKKFKFSNVTIGDEFGTTDNKGYRKGSFKKTIYLSARLIWRYMTGDDPGTMLVDHIDRDRSNNKWSNLRLADPALNSENVSKHRDGKSPYKNVTYCKATGRWRANFRRNNILRVSPRYDTPEEARDWALVKAEQWELHQTL